MSLRRSTWKDVMPPDKRLSEDDDRAGVDLVALGQKIRNGSTLAELSDEEFRAVVNADCRMDRNGMAAEAVALLRQPENTERWWLTLLNMKRSVEVQMTAKRAELEAWRQGANRFRNSLEDRIAEAKTLREKPVSYLDLRAGILAHKIAITADPDTAETADTALWRLADADDTMGSI